MVHTLTPEIESTFADKASVVLETAKFMIELKKEQTTEFATKIVGLAEKAKCKPCGAYDGLNDTFIRLTHES